MSAAKLFARIRKLTDKIVDLQGKFDLPKGHPDRFETYGGAQELQKARTERQAAQGGLDPIRLIATGVSCRDCRHFADVEEPRCYAMWNRRLVTDGWPTKVARSHVMCGPEARWFETAALNA